MFKNKILMTALFGAYSASLFNLNTSLAFNEGGVMLASVEEQNAESAVVQAEGSKSSSDIQSARTLVNNLPESSKKNELQGRLDAIFDISDITFNELSATANVDVYIKSENMLSLTLDTNSITFDDFSGVEDMEKLGAVNITINSSLPYELNAYLPSEIQNGDKSQTMDKQILNIKEGTEPDYKTFLGVNQKLTLKDNNVAGNDLTHSIDLKLKGGIAHEKDVYKATIKFEAQQK